jgi:hypothetical protein|tara:strand:+ start:963 stop:2108 length:1146 start_codon:yes stop_codon:yes gene_type:complete
MAITETIQAKEFTAGAPDITLKGDLRPNQMMASGPDMTDSINELALQLFGKELRLLTEEELDILRDEAERLTQKYMASGGRAQYGLGSIVKSIGKAVKGAVKGVAKGVKSFARSDLGKAALLGAGIYGLGGGFGTGFKLGNLPGASLFSGMSAKGKGTLASFAIGSLGSAVLSAAEAGGLDTSDPNAEVDLESLTGYLTKGYKNLNPNATDEEVFQFVQENTAEYRAMGGRIGYSDGTPSFEEYMRERKGIEQKMNMERLYKEYLEDLRRKKVAEEKTMAATGGRIGYAMGTDEKVTMAAGIEGLPVRQNKAGVKELDLRETGGFIQPVGIKEKADDIPAMLSNNEFVFTADAVRAAGGGDVDKGAQLMYDTMKKLESKVV